MKSRRTVLQRPYRPWRCLLCPERGREVDEKATTAAFYRHYMANHNEGGMRDGGK